LAAAAILPADRPRHNRIARPVLRKPFSYTAKIGLVLADEAVAATARCSLRSAGFVA